ncbi:B3 domain-containing protein [Capsicum galapagoense]
MERENKACDGCKNDCRLIHGKGVLSFFKVMIDKSFLKFLYFPPKFARSVSHLTDQKTYLEDSSGRRWMVRVCKHDGSLAIKQGWPEFSSEHGLKVGEFLVFHYVPGKHFIVQIFGTSACEKIKFCSDIGKGRKRARAYPEATNPVELLQTTAIDSVKKKSKLSAALESEKATYKPNIASFAGNVDTDTEKGRSVHSAIHVDESFRVIDRNAQYDQTTTVGSVKKKSKLSAALESEMVTNKPNIANFAVNVDTDTEKGRSVHSAIHVDESFRVIDRNAQYDQTTAVGSVKQKSKLSAALESEKVMYKPNNANFAVNADTDTEKGRSVHSPIHVDESFCVIDRNAQYDQEDDRLCLHLSSFEMPAIKPLAEGISSPLKGDNGNDNHVETNSRSQTKPNLNFVPAIKPLAEGISSPLKGDNGNDNHVETNSRSQTKPNLNFENKKLKSEALLSQLEAGITAINNVSRPAEDFPPLAEDIPPRGPKYRNSKEAFQFPREARVVKKEIEDVPTEAFFPARAVHGGEYANGNQKVIKSEPADSGDAPSLNAVNYSCLLEIDGRDFLELPESWRKHLPKKAKQGRMIIFLRGPDKRIWPVFYHSRSRFNVLTFGWKQVVAAYGLNPGNECLFQLVDQRECIFDVRKI